MWVVVDSDELRAQGGRVLGGADDIEHQATLGVLRGREHWDLEGLRGPADRFSARFGFLLKELASEVEHAGNTLRGTAEAYDYMDMSASESFSGRAWVEPEW